MTPKLSICIPTYNRAAYLAQCLESVIQALFGYEDVVEIIVSDNCSTDNTEKILADLQAKNTLLKVWRNNENVGGDRNILLAGMRGRGEYVWILGDDDKIRPEAVKEVLKRINVKPDLVICNFSSHTKLFEREIAARYFRVTPDKQFKRRDDVLKTFGMSLGFISSVVFRGQYLRSAPVVEYEKYFDYGWAFLKILFGSLPVDCQVEYISTPMVCNRLGNSAIPDWAKWFVKGSAILLEDLEAAGYSSDSVASAKNLVIRDYVVNYIVNSKADGRPLGALFHYLRHYYNHCWRYWGQCLPLAMVPAIILSILKKTYIRLRDLKRARIYE